MKVIVTKEQMDRMSKKNEYKPNVIRGYTFDWDDNILFMPTKIKMLHNGEVVEVSTSDFSELRNDPNYKIFDDSFVDFRSDEPFYDDLVTALENEQYGPSFNKFKESLLYANPFAIITARGHSPKALKRGVEIFIGEVFTEDEMEFMLDNIKRQYKDIAFEDDMYTVLDYYLSQQQYSPVSSKEFQDKYNIEGEATNPEEGKKIALRDYVSKIVENVKDIVNDVYKTLSIGFSDDDKGNIESIKNLIMDELSHEYPQVKFIVYDTSSGGKNKLVIKRDNN